MFSGRADKLEGRAGGSPSELAIPDLSDPASGQAVSQLPTAVSCALAERWEVSLEEHRPSPLVDPRDNYDCLGFSPDDVTRASRYSRHVSPTVMLRSHTSAGVPAVRDSMRPELGRYDTLHVLPGLVCRRYAVDRTHVGTRAGSAPLGRTGPGPGHGHGPGHGPGHGHGPGPGTHAAQGH